MKNKGFTVAEFLICIVIIGFITIFQLQTLNKSFASYDAAYYNAYESIKKAGYAVYTDLYCQEDVEEHGGNADTVCKVKDGAFTARPFPDKTEDLCVRLSDYLNTPTTNCSNPDDKKDISPKANNDEFDETHERLITSNSFKIYLSALNSKEFKDAAGNEIKYFVIWVDLNGSKQPNRVNPILKKGSDSVIDEKSIPPDIVPFAITTMGDVLPMGYPAYTDKYMTVRNKLPVTYCLNGTDSSGKACEGSVKEESYRLASIHAYGNKELIDMPQTVDFTYDFGAVQAGDIKDCNALSAIAGKIESVHGTDMPADPYRNKYHCIPQQYACVTMIDKYNTRLFK